MLRNNDHSHEESQTMFHRTPLCSLPDFLVQPRQLMIAQRLEWSVSSAPLATQSSRALAMHRYSLLGGIPAIWMPKRRDTFSYDEHEENIRRAVDLFAAWRPWREPSSVASTLTGASSRICKVRFDIIFFFVDRAVISQRQLSHLVADQTPPGSDWPDRRMSLRLQGSRQMTHNRYDNNDDAADM